MAWDVGFECMERIPPKQKRFVLTSLMSLWRCNFTVVSQESTGDMIISGSCETSSFAAT